MTKLIDGYYKAVDNFYKFAKKDGDQWYGSNSGGSEFHLAVEYGDFGEADPIVQEMSGLKNYNIRIKLTFSIEDDDSKNKPPAMIDLGILYDNGNRGSFKGAAGISQLIKISEKEYQDLLNDFDPIEAPPNNYKIQPENQGKIIWISGPPGSGKSTTAQYLAKTHDYVYYEADCFGSLKNPFIPLDLDNPSMGQMQQKILGGPGFEERKDMLRRTMKFRTDLCSGREFDRDLMREFYNSLALDISRQKERIGGNWAVAAMLMKKDIRDCLREVLGPDLIIVSLSLSNTDRRERILERHQGDETTANRMDQLERIMDPIEEDEPNTIVLDVTRFMTREEVVENVRKCIQI